MIGLTIIAVCLMLVVLVRCSAPNKTKITPNNQYGSFYNKVTKNGVETDNFTIYCHGREVFNGIKYGWCTFYVPSGGVITFNNCELNWVNIVAPKGSEVVFNNCERNWVDTKNSQAKMLVDTDTWEKSHGCSI